MNDRGISVCLQAPLARHTPWRTGGPCEAMVWIHEQGRLLDALSELRATQTTWSIMGSGTRAVVRDGGMNGVVVRLGTDFSRLDRSDPDLWEAGAALPVPAVVEAARREGRSGLAELAAIPGTVGASILLDSGWEDVVDAVWVIHRGRAVWKPLDEVQGRKRLVIGVRLALGRTSVSDETKRIRKRLSSPRLAPPNSWYVPPKRGRLREILGSVELPDVRLRRVHIPESGPEVLVNLGGGTAADLYLLHRSALDRVKAVRGVVLDSRIRFIGRRADDSRSGRA